MASILTTAPSTSAVNNANQTPVDIHHLFSLVQQLQEDLRQKKACNNALQQESTMLRGTQALQHPSTNLLSVDTNHDHLGYSSAYEDVEVIPRPELIKASSDANDVYRFSAK